MRLKDVISNMRNSQVDFIQEYRNVLDNDMCDFFINKFKKLDKSGEVKSGRVNNVTDGEYITEVNKFAKKTQKNP